MQKHLRKILRISFHNIYFNGSKITKKYLKDNINNNIFMNQVHIIDTKFEPNKSDIFTKKYAEDNNV